MGKGESEGVMEWKGAEIDEGQLRIDWRPYPLRIPQTTPSPIKCLAGLGLACRRSPSPNIGRAAREKEEPSVMLEGHVRCGAEGFPDGGGLIGGWSEAHA